MLVHVSEGSMDQERAREPTHGLRGWQPCLKVTYVYEGVHVRSRHVIPLLIPSPSSGFVSLRIAPGNLSLPTKPPSHDSLTRVAHTYMYIVVMINKL